MRCVVVAGMRSGIAYATIIAMQLGISI